MVSSMDGRVDLPGGRALPLSEWQPRGRPQAVVLALHSYGDFRLAYEETGPWLAAHGVAVRAIDQRGFGETAEHGHWPGWRRLVTEVGEALTALRPRDATPVFLLGESLGGGVALAAMRLPGMFRPTGLILAEPAVRNGVRLRLFWDLVFGGLAFVRPGFRRPLVRGQHPLLTDAARRRLSEDPRIVRHIRADAYKGLLAIGDQASAAAQRLTVPTLLVYGRADGIIPHRLLERAEHDLASVVTAIRYPDAPHLLLQARGWERIMADALAWMQGSFAPLPDSPGVLRRRGPLPVAPASRQREADDPKPQRVGPGLGREVQADAADGVRR